MRRFYIAIMILMSSVGAWATDGDLYYTRNEESSLGLFAKIEDGRITLMQVGLVSGVIDTTRFSRAILLVQPIEQKPHLLLVEEVFSFCDEFQVNFGKTLRVSQIEDTVVIRDTAPGGKAYTLKKASSYDEGKFNYMMAKPDHGCMK